MVALHLYHKSGSKAKKKKRKSHPRVTKNCRCKDRQHCDHAWINADLGAGTVVKSTGKMYWGHKASTLGFGEQEVLLDAVAMSDAASHDSRSLVPHLSRLFQRHPDLRGLVTRVLDDGAADDRFGISVAISGATAIIGAYYDDDNGENSGSAYVFDAGGAPCPGDLDGDGDVDQNDLGILLACYNIDDGGDLDGDGDTDQNDLGFLLAFYGIPCP